MAGKSKKGLVIGLVVGLLLLGGGGFVGAAYMGLVKVPGITPKSKLAKNAASQYKADPKDAKKKEPEKPKVATPAPKPKAPPKPKEPTLDPDAGDQRVADVWSQMEVAQLAEVVKDWRDPELARVLVKMDEKRTAELLSLIEPRRASRLSRAIQAESSRVPDEL